MGNTEIKEFCTSRPSPGQELADPPPCTTQERHPRHDLYEWHSLGLCSAQPAWTFPGVVQCTTSTAAMNIFRVTNIPNRGRKRGNLLLSCPETGSQNFLLANDGTLWSPDSVPMPRGATRPPKKSWHSTHPQEKWKKHRDNALLGGGFRKINSKAAAHSSQKAAGWHSQPWKYLKSRGSLSCSQKS